MKKILLIMFGLILGFILFGVSVKILMPKLMIVTKESKFDYETTVSKLEESIKENKWKHNGTFHITKELGKSLDKSIEKQIAVVKLCKGKYANAILEKNDSRFVSCLMPCGISVWEGDDGKVYLSKMNTGLMGKIFGGIIADIMGGKVGPEEDQILKDIVL